MEKRYHNVFSTFVIWFEVYIQPFLNSTKGLNILAYSNLFTVRGLHFQTHPKLNHDILGFLNKSKTAGHCGFPLTNLHSGESVYCLPKPTILRYTKNVGLVAGS